MINDARGSAAWMNISRMCLSLYVTMATNDDDDQPASERSHVAPVTAAHVVIIHFHRPTPRY
jgi:hypothetical protein